MHLSTSLNLSDEILCANFGDALKNRLCVLRRLVRPRLCLLPCPASSTFNHVAEEGPRSGAEPNEGDFSLEAVPSLCDGGIDVLELLEDVGLAVEDALLSVLGALEGMGEVRTDAAEHLNLHAHRLGNDKDVGEDDAGVEEAFEAADGLESDLAGKFGGAADGKERVLLPHGLKLGEVAPGLAHDPDGGRAGEGEGVGVVGGGLEEGIVEERGEVGVVLGKVVGLNGDGDGMVNLLLLLRLLACSRSGRCHYRRRKCGRGSREDGKDDSDSRRLLAVNPFLGCVFLTFSPEYDSARGIADRGKARKVFPTCKVVVALPPLDRSLLLPLDLARVSYTPAHSEYSAARPLRTSLLLCPLPHSPRTPSTPSTPSSNTISRNPPTTRSVRPPTASQQQSAPSRAADRPCAARRGREDEGRR